MPQYYPDIMDRVGGLLKTLKLERARIIQTLREATYSCSLRLCSERANARRASMDCPESMAQMFQTLEETLLCCCARVLTASRSWSHIIRDSLIFTEGLEFEIKLLLLERERRPQ